MNEQNERTGFCPECAAELHIPAGLSEFSCMYCGARLTPEQLVAQPRSALSEEDAEQSFRAAAAQLAGCIRNYPGYNRKILRDEFAAAFEAYEQGTTPIFEQLDCAVRAQEERRAALLDEAAETMLNDLEAAWQSDPKWKSKSGRTAVRDDDKVILAIFFVPALRKQALSVSEELSTRIHEKWMVRHPDSPFYLGDYETLVGGFRKKFLGLCFITTAVCEAQGLPDDCAELTAFRAFRDGYLRACPDGEALISEYYNIAPGIVTCIDLGSDRAAKDAAIRETWLEPCYRALQENRPERCKERYVRMVRSLEREYLS